nr:MAG TPA_asm: hypothetical protein [Bacteriophage sp.]
MAKSGFFTSLPKSLTSFTISPQKFIYINYKPKIEKRK